MLLRLLCVRRTNIFIFCFYYPAGRCCHQFLNFFQRTTKTVWSGVPKSDVLHFSSDRFRRKFINIIGSGFTCCSGCGTTRQTTLPADGCAVVRIVFLQNYEMRKFLCAYFASQKKKNQTYFLVFELFCARVLIAFFCFLVFQREFYTFSRTF